MNNKLKPCPFCGGNASRAARFNMGYSGDGVKCGKCKAETPSYLVEQKAVDWWNTRADGWIEVDGAKNIPIGNWIVATCDKESKVATHIAECRANVIIIGRHFHFDMPKVYAYKEIGELPIPPKAASCGE